MKLGVDTSHVTCRYCGVTGAVEIEWRDTFVARPLGTYSLTGQQMKASGSMRPWPWAVCRLEFGGCGHESRGERSEN